ncbi:MAG: penicillin acylase family protein [Acidobacteria bacterium]|nr:penicillin acylase family protein [Acidobacteriota bacterium]
MGGAAHAQAPAPALDTRATLSVPGLHQRVEVIRDRWGINHIYAANEDDLFMAQGYLAARDRLFQFEIWRRRATGTVAEILGPRELTRDIGTRLHRFRGDLDAELNHYHPRGKAIVEAYVRGVNAQVDEALRSPSTLPIEFRMLGITPGRWTPEVVVSRHQALTSNLPNEVTNTRALAAIGADGLRDLLWLQGGDPPLVLDPLIDAKTFPADVLKVYNAFRDTIHFRPEDVAPAYRSQERAEAADEPALARSSDGGRIVDTGIGSNNWVVSGAKTQSGMPIMANDPHRVIEAPSLRYWVHLVAPGWNVIGGGEPVLPGVSIGHNDYGAWGLTVFGTDSEDLYVYETNPANADEYRYRGQWEAMRVVTETIPVKGQPAATATLKYTRHGPVLYEDAAKHRAYALRAGWMETGGAPYLSSLRMNQAKSWAEFAEACTYNRMPSENMVWVDTSGTIGWQAAGIAPLRSWSGLLPVPGDGRYEWDGYLPINALPSEVNPTRGFIATANHYLFPNDYPYPNARHYTWADPYRAHRIEEVVGSGRRFSVAEMTRLQNDDLSMAARAIVPLLRDLPFANPAVAGARDLVLRWDFVLDKNSNAAAVYELFSRRLITAVRQASIPAAARAAVPAGLISTKRAIDFLYAPDGRFGAEPTKGRDQMVTTAFEQGVADVTARFGADMAAWKWGDEKLHHAFIRHPLSDAVNAEMKKRLEVGPFPRGGDGTTVSATGGNDNQTSGGSLKIVADTDNWDNSVGLNTPGQSGNPDDPHYRDLFELWARGRYFPVAYSRGKVESVAETTTTLSPAAGPTAGRPQ